MKQIYDFEQYNPPVLNENMLRNEVEKRTIKMQTAVLLVAGMLVQMAVGLFGFLHIDTYPMITILCIGYVLISTIGGTVLIIFFTRKGGNELWQPQV